MNRLLFLFIASLLTTLISQAIYIDGQSSFETVDSLVFASLNEHEVIGYFEGDEWLENRVTSKPVDLNSIYQQNAFKRSLSNKSEVKRYQKSFTTWIEERLCKESPFIDKPVRARMTSRFGTRFHPVSGKRHVHAGIDFRGGTGTPVLAASAGIVKAARRKGAYGKTLIVDHGNSYTTLYAHLSGYAVKEGDWVNLGQTIGYIGKTGRATGPHLHFEIRCHNVPLNPRKYLGKMGQIAEVKFKRRRRMASAPGRKPAFVKRDPNYFTRMINLQKLKQLQKKAKRF